MSIGGFFMGLGGMLLINLVMLLFGWVGFPVPLGSGTTYPFLILGIDGVLTMVFGLVVGRLVYVTERDNRIARGED